MSQLAKIAAYWRNTRQMPWLIRMFCQGFMVTAPIFLLLLFLPIGWKVNGQDLSYSEFWAAGHAPVMGSTLILVTIGTWGAAARNGKSRWALILGVSFPYLVALLFGVFDASSSGYAWVDVLGVLSMSGFLYLFLFRWPAVANYYSGGLHDAESA